jgi:hypothetical protein
VHAAAGALADARHAFEDGLATLERAQMWPQAAQLARAWAEALDGAGEPAEATAARAQAAAFERRLAAPAASR